MSNLVSHEVKTKSGQGIGTGFVAKGISKHFGSAAAQLEVLRDISFAVSIGKFVTIVGSSGCGKSTLLHILAGLLSSSSGSLDLNGQPIEGPHPDKIGVVFQDAWLLPWKSALENVEFPLSLRGIPKKVRRERALAQLEIVSLLDAVDKYPHELSGGMRQRVSIARGLVQQPSVLLMDEPFSALDEQTRTRMGHELLGIWERTGCTVIFITHGLTEAVYLADEILVMGARPGRIIERINVPLPRPREVDMIGSEEFGRLRNHIWHLIADES